MDSSYIPLKARGFALDDENKEFKLYDWNKGLTSEISEVGVLFWKLCDGKRNVKEILTILRETFTENHNKIELALETNLQYFIMRKAAESYCFS